MNLSEKQTRFDELCAGSALGDLTPEEEIELSALAAELDTAPDENLEWLATAAEVAAVQAGSSEAMPAAFAKRLEDWAIKTAPPPPSNVLEPDVSQWRAIVRSPITGWAAAAAVLIFSLLFSQRDEVAQKSQALSPGQAESRLRAQATDLIERDFTGLGPYEGAAGSVIWSDARQEGYMILEGIPANDRQTAQYQLWIVDPSRDEAPVDGGVFDIPAGGSRVVVPITAKLQVTQPQAFLITLEQPGGVVKSKREIEVALAAG